jgi:RNA polymerase sigma-70 factor (ECF subfamily)
MRADLMTSSTPAVSRFYELISPHSNQVMQVARLLAHNETDAEDLSQDTMLKAFRRIDDLRDRDRIGPWLLTILRNTFIDRTRSRKHRALSLDELEYEPADTHGTAAPATANYVENPDEAINWLADKSLIGALRQLPRDIRRTVLLVDVEGLQEAEAAHALGIPVGTVKSRLHRGRNLLRPLLESVARDRRMLN